jgi:hypothetical protein
MPLPNVLPKSIAGGEIFDGWRVHTGSQSKAGEDAGTGCHRSVLAPARADGAIGAGHVAVGGLNVPKVSRGKHIANDGLMRGFQRRSLGPDRGAVRIDIAELKVDCHTPLP